MNDEELEKEWEELENQYKLKIRSKKLLNIMNRDKTKQMELNKLESDLQRMKEYNTDIWCIYGSELCAGDMIKKEQEIENKIKELKNNLK